MDLDKLRKNLLPIKTYARIDIKRLFRDKVAIFFIFVFPLIFLVIFGSIFSGGDGMSFRVGLLNNSDSQFAAKFVEQIKENEVFEVDDEATSLELSKEKMNRGQLEATIILP